MATQSKAPSAALVAARAAFTEDPSAYLADMQGVEQALTTLGLSERTFSTGSVGYSANGKVSVGGRRYQVSINAILVGSKPGA